MIPITDQLSIDEADLQFQYVQAGGPGGQNVNKVATAVALRFNLSGLPDDVRARLLILAGRRINQAGELVIQAGRYRTQEQNRADALRRLVDLLRSSAEPPRPRRATRPTLASKQRRLAQKRQRAEVKNRRRERFSDE